jgi:hypothetical protein
VVVDWTFPPPRTVDRLTDFPLGPVVVEVVLTCADAASVQRVRNDTTTVRERKFILFLLVFGSLCCAPTDLLRTLG